MRRSRSSRTVSSSRPTSRAKPATLARRQRLPRTSAERPPRDGGGVRRHRPAAQRRAVHRRGHERRGPRRRRSRRGEQARTADRRRCLQQRVRRSSSRSRRTRWAPRGPGSRPRCRSPDGTSSSSRKGSGYGISRRLDDDERQRLRDIAKRIRPEGFGVIVRTAAEGVDEAELDAGRRAAHASVGGDRRPRTEGLGSAGDLRRAGPRHPRRPRPVLQGLRPAGRSRSPRVLRPRRSLPAARLRPSSPSTSRLHEGPESLVRRLQRHRSDAQGARAQGVASVGRLHRHRPGRGAHRRST